MQMARRDKLPEEVHAEWLAELLAGEAPDVARLREVMKTVGESVHLEYKAASEDDDPKHPGEKDKLRSVLQRYVAGFANGAGGVLVYGVKELKTEEKKGHPRRVIGYELDPLTTLSREEVDRIVNRELAGLHPYLPQWACRRSFVDGLHEGQEILVIAVDRVDRLVPVVEKQSANHYLRIGDSTVAAPAYLSEDILTGRRRKPDLRVGAYFHLHEHRDGRCRGSVTIQVENVGLTWAEQPRAGIIALQWSDPGRDGSSSLPPEILKNIEELPQTRHPDVECELRRVLRDRFDAPEKESLGTFEVHYLGLRLEVPVVGDRTIWAAAVFISCRNDEPRWGQLLVRVDREDLVDRF